MKMNVGHLDDFQENDDYFHHFFYENETLQSVDLQFLSVSSSHFKNCKFLDVYFYQVNLSKCHFENCQFLNTSFANCTMESNQFESCEFVNLKWFDGKDYKSKYLHTLWKYVEMHEFSFDMSYFEDCDFIQNDILKCRYHDVNFSLCRFTDSNYRLCPCFDVNFSTSFLKDTYFDINSFKNCILTPSQGLELLAFYEILFHEDS